MDTVPVYEYYDGHEELWSENPENREKVEYIELGEVNEYTIGICYVGELKSLAVINKNTHKRAWTIDPITKEDAIKYVKEAYQSESISLEKYREQYTYLQKKKHELNMEHILPENHSRSTYDGRWKVSYCYDNTRRYAEQFAYQIEKRIHLFEAVERYLTNH
jgi:hypothetical protein